MYIVVPGLAAGFTLWFGAVALRCAFDDEVGTGTLKVPRAPNLFDFRIL